MRGKKAESEVMADGLAMAKDPFNIAGLLTQKKEDLAAHVSDRIRYTALDMTDQGRYFHAIKNLCVHGEWEDLVKEQRWSWDYVRACMKLTEVAAWLPLILKVPGGGPIRQLLRLPKPEIQQIINDLSPEEVEALSPWKLRSLHSKVPKNSSPARKKKAYPEPTEDDLPTELDILAAKAQSALMQIYELKIGARERKRAERYVIELRMAWDRAHWNLRDPEHKTTPIWELHPMADDITEDEDAPSAEVSR